MKKLLLLSALFLAFGASGQAILNGSFESWNSIPYDNLTGWWNSNPQSYPMTGKMSCLKSTTSHSGSYAVELQSVSNGSDTMGGFILNANPNNKGASNNFVGGVPYSSQPSKITGYYKYSPQGKDSAAVMVIFKKTGSIISQDIFKLGQSSVYAAFSFNLSLKSVPDTMIIGAVSSVALIGNNNYMTGVIPGSTLFIDDLAFTGNGTMPAIPGGNFETGWTTSDYLTPVGWSENNGDPESITQTSPGYKGNYAIQLETLSPNSDAGITNGMMSPHNGPIGGGKPFTNKIDTLIGYYKYTSVGKDSGSVYLQLSKNGNPIWGTGISLAPKSTYTMFSIPFNVGTTPDSMRIDFWNNNSNNGIAHVGSTLILDEVQLKSAQLNTGTEESNWIANKVKVYPNPALNKITFEFSDQMTSGNELTLKIFNGLGKVAFEQNYSGKTEMINLDLATFTKGVYFYNFINGPSYINGSFIKQ